MEYSRVPSPLKTEWLLTLQKQAELFAFRKTLDLNARFFCDCTPWNLRVQAVLQKIFPQGIFVLTLRHYSGVIDSLERSYRDGWSWAGPEECTRINLWAEMYSRSIELPDHRTIPISYDQLTSDPEQTLGKFRMRLEMLGVSTTRMDSATFCQSHSNIKPRPTLGTTLPSGEASLSPIASFYKPNWPAARIKAISEQVAMVERQLKERFPSDYTSPSGW